jgi:hypothetical protein
VTEERTTRSSRREADGATCITQTHYIATTMKAVTWSENKRATEHTRPIRRMSSHVGRPSI